MRNISSSLPKFVVTPDDSKYAAKEKLGRGRWMPSRNTKIGRFANFSINTFQKFRLRFLIVFGLIFATILFYTTRKLLWKLVKLAGTDGLHSAALLLA